MKNQSKIIIIFWVLSSLLIFFTAFFVIEKTSDKISDTYHNFGLMLTQTLSAETTSNINKIAPDIQRESVKKYCSRLIEVNSDIDFIDYNTTDVKLHLTSKNPVSEKNKNSYIINAPLYLDSKVIGSVDIGFNGNSISGIERNTKLSVIIVFSVMWLLSLIAVLMNTHIVMRQINILLSGVRRIASGEFGYKLNQSNLWGEIRLLFKEFNKMSVRLRQYEENNIDELTYEKNKLESVLMSIANGVIVCDSSDNVILVNNAGSSMLGTSAGFLGENINNYADDSGNFIFQKYISEFKTTPLDDMKNEPLAFQITIDAKVFKTLMSPIFTMNDEYLGYIVVLHDITKEAEVDKLKSNFISNVSHELRTPVTVLRSYIDTLCNYNSDFDEATKMEFLQTMNQEAIRLNNMVNDILDFSRLDSENVKIEKGFMDIKPIVENTVKSMQIIAQEKNIVFEVSVEPDLPNLYINQDSIERVLKNLISNAIKYSNENSRIIISVRKNNKTNSVICTVQDFGIGIPKESLPKIFERFYRVENSTHSVKGTGLGLHLVKVTIEKQHDGKVFAESEINKGSTFGFSLPVLDENSKLNDIAVQDKIIS